MFSDFKKSFPQKNHFGILSYLLSWKHLFQIYFRLLRRTNKLIINNLLKNIWHDNWLFSIWCCKRTPLLCPTVRSLLGIVPVCAKALLVSKSKAKKAAEEEEKAGGNLVANIRGLRPRRRTNGPKCRNPPEICPRPSFSKPKNSQFEYYFDVDL